MDSKSFTLDHIYTGLPCYWAQKFIYIYLQELCLILLFLESFNFRNLELCSTLDSNNLGLNLISHS